jgi:hypothetical protein
MDSKLSNHPLLPVNRRGNGAALASALMCVFTGALIGCSGTKVDTPPENGTRKTIMVVSITAEKNYQNPFSDTLVNHPCNSISGYCMGSPVPGIDSILVNGQEVPFKVVTDDDGLAFDALYLADTLPSTYTGLKSLRVVTSEGTATGEVEVPFERTVFYTPFNPSAGSNAYLILDGRTNYYEVAAWFKLTDNLYNFDVYDTIVADTLFRFPSGWFDTTRSDMIQIFASGINGVVPIYGASANIDGTAVGYLFARNNTFGLFSQTVDTRNLLQKKAADVNIKWPQKPFTMSLEKRLALQARNQACN